MNNNAIEIEARFSEAELFSMFNVECEPNAFRQSDVCHKPLLHVRVRKAKPSARIRHTCDKIRAGVTEEPPGKARVADLVRFYNNPLNTGLSPFEVK